MAIVTSKSAVRSVSLCVFFLFFGGQILLSAQLAGTGDTKNLSDVIFHRQSGGPISAAWGGGTLYPGQIGDTGHETGIQDVQGIISPGAVTTGAPHLLMSGAGPVPVPTFSAGETHFVEAQGSTQIVFGWIPDPAALNPSARNSAELSRMLRDKNLLDAITVAGIEKECTRRSLSDIRQLPQAFKDAVEEEWKAREDPAGLWDRARSYEVEPPATEKHGADSQARFRPFHYTTESDASATAEFSLLQAMPSGLVETHQTPEQIYDRPQREEGNALNQSDTAKDNPAEGFPGEAGKGTAMNFSAPLPQPIRQQTRQREGENATEKRLFAIQLKLHLQCKLAALLGHPQVFLNPKYTDLELLAAVAKAIGLSPERNEKQADSEASELSGAVELMHMASNPFTLGYLILLGIAHLEAHKFFSASPAKPFYSWATLASAAVGDTAFHMVDEMCETDRGPGGAKNKAWFQRGGSRKHLNPEITPLLQHLCNNLEIILNGIQLAYTESLDELAKYKINVEPLVDPGTNSARIQTRLCRGLSPICTYEDSILFPTKPQSEQERRDSLQTKKAFNLLTAFGSGQVGSIHGQILTPFKDTWSSHWASLLADPTAYSDVLKKSLWWDQREFIAAKKGFFFAAQRQMEKRSHGVFQLAGGGLSVREILQRIKVYLQKSGERLSTMRSARRVAKERMDAFNIAILLNLSSRRPCARPGSFLQNLKQFAADHYKKISKNRRIPGSQRSLMAFVRTGQLELYYNWCNFDPLALNYLFLLRYALSGPDAAALHDKQRAIVARSKKTLRILQSKWTPTFFKRLIRGFNQKALTQQAKTLLIRSLDPNIFSGVLTSFDFITHTHANMVVNQKAFMFHDVKGGARQNFTTDTSAYKLHSEGLAKHADGMIKKWAEYGIPGDIKRRLAKGEELPKGVNFGNIPIPDLSQWDTQLSSKWTEAYNGYLEHPYGRAALKARDPVALLVKESRDRLQTEAEATVFLGRIASPVRRRGGVFKIARALKSFFMSLLREQEMSEYAVWFGVKIDIKQVMQICRAINSVAEVVKNDRVYNFVTDGWNEIVKDVVAMYTDMPTRIPNYDFISAASEENRANNVAAAIRRNQGFLNIHHSYASLPEDERKREFQLSMCADHCGALWNLIMGFVMPNLQNPAKLQGYEQEFAKTKEVERLNDPHRVNAFRFGLGVQVDFFDNMIDKHSKKSIKQMKFGASLWFAYAMKLAGQVNSAMANPNLGTTLYMQAPYYGNYIREWIEQRRKARKQAILGMLTLGLLGMYTLLSVTDVVQHMEDIGGGPPVQCVENLLLGPGCAPQAIAQATTSAAKVAAQDVFKVGLFSAISPYLCLPMAIISVWNILKSEIKILLQFEMAVKNMFGRLKRWLAKPFKNWWNKRKRLKNSLFKRASDTFNKTKETTKQEPQPRDLHDPSNWGKSDMDSLNLPPERGMQEFTISYTTPSFPLSAPLICSSA